jgi:hypothetical protein
MHGSSHTSWFDHYNNTWWVQFIKFSMHSRHFLSFGFKYPPHFIRLCLRTYLRTDTIFYR